MFKKQITPEIAKELILQYQQTRSESIFFDLLCKYDDLLLYAVHKACSIDDRLADEDPQELYHISIVGMHSAILSMKPDAPARYIVARILFYIRAEFRKQFRYKDKEVVWSTDDFEKAYRKGPFGKSSKVGDYYSMKQYVNTDLISLLEGANLTEDEEVLIFQRFLEGYQIREIAANRGVKDYTVGYRLGKALNKIRSTIVKKRRRAR